MPDLDAIRARLAAATPGPWEADALEGCVVAPSGDVATVTRWSDADADLIAAAPTDLSALLVELRATTGDLAVAVEVARERRERIRTQMQVIGEQEDQIVALTEVAEAAREHVAAEKDTDLPRIGRAHDAMESALDAWRAGGGE